MVNVNLQSLKQLLNYFPIFLTFYRLKQDFTYVLKVVSASAIIFYPALYFLLDSPDLLSYTVCFAFLTFVCWAAYEINYLINDFVAVKREDMPFFRSYTQDINFIVALAIRLIFLVLSAYILRFNIYFLEWLFFLGVYIALLNILKTKKERLPIYPCLRLLRHLFVPIILSDFNFQLLYPCFVLLLPLLFIDARSFVLMVVTRYLEMKRENLGLDITYYETILKTLPLQIFLLLNYPPVILSGELFLALISFIGKKRLVKR